MSGLETSIGCQVASLVSPPSSSPFSPSPFLSPSALPPRPYFRPTQFALRLASATILTRLSCSIFTCELPLPLPLVPVVPGRRGRAEGAASCAQHDRDGMHVVGVRLLARACDPCLRVRGLWARHVYFTCPRSQTPRFSGSPSVPGGLNCDLPTPPPNPSLSHARLYPTAM